MTGEPIEDGQDMVEVARAHDGIEAKIWVRFLQDYGLTATTKRMGGLLRAILYLGQVPVSVRVSRRDASEAREHLKKARLI